MKTISQAVGKYPGKNLPKDVTTVQELLNSVGPANGGPFPPLKEHGSADPTTIRAIEKFQFQHFGIRGTDGCVEPNGPTLAKLNELSHGGSGCAKWQVLCFQSDYVHARTAVDAATSRLVAARFTPAEHAPGSKPVPAETMDARIKVRNVFGIDLIALKSRDPASQLLELSRFEDLVLRYRKLLTAFQEEVPFVCEPGGARLEGAWVDASNNHSNPTIHLERAYWGYTASQRAVILVHERAHTVLKLNGHPATGSPNHLPIGVLPHLGDKAIRYPNSINNAWCYEWLTGSLQRDYTPQRYSRIEPTQPESTAGQGR